MGTACNEQTESGLAILLPFGKWHLAVVVMLLPFLAKAWQSDSVRQAFVKKIAEPIRPDGVLDEPIWQTIEPVNHFWQYAPSDSVPAEYQTELYFAYDDQYLYVGVKCHAAGNRFIVPSLRRDYRGGGSDNINLLFDTFNDRTNAFHFGLNPYGVRRESLISNGGRNRSDFDSSWDNRWQGDARMYDNYWTAEFAIPFRTLRYKEGQQHWRFNCYRIDAQNNEFSVWQRVPRNQWIFNVAYMGVLAFEEPLGKPGRNLSVIPYLTAGMNQDFLENGGASAFHFNAGGDVKVGLSAGLNLDLTVNPDFSQVEVDRQVTNLTRFEVFLPEKRQFFLENADLFGRFGEERVNPFFSRRIGISIDTATGQNIQNPIWFGARLSGKLTEEWRVGLLDIQAAPDAANGLPAYNYAVAAVQRRVFTRSNIGAIAVSKQALDEPGSDEFSAYNRVLGLHYNHFSADNRWVGQAYYLRSFSPEGGARTDAHGASLSYTERRFRVAWTHSYVGENFRAEVGFVPRTNFWRIRPEARLYFYSPDGWLNQHGPGVEAEVIFQPGLGRTDHKVGAYWDVQFRDNSRGRITLQHNYIFLKKDFDPTRSPGATPLPGQQGYNFVDVEMRYGSDRRKPLFVRGRTNVGQFYNGWRLSFNGSLSWRLQPYAVIELSTSYNYVALPEPYPTAAIVLIGPRIDLTFSRSLFLTTFFQYNRQIDNININARLQWRFAPVSDIFLVYTDNYYASDLGQKNRAIVFKMSYWLNP